MKTDSFSSHLIEPARLNLLYQDFEHHPELLGGCNPNITVPVFYGQIRYEMTVLEVIPLDELFHMINHLLFDFCSSVETHMASFFTRGISREGFPLKRGFLGPLFPNDINSYDDRGLGSWETLASIAQKLEPESPNRKVQRRRCPSQLLELAT